MFHCILFFFIKVEWWNNIFILLYTNLSWRIKLFGKPGGQDIYLAPKVGPYKGARIKMLVNFGGPILHKILPTAQKFPRHIFTNFKRLCESLMKSWVLNYIFCFIFECAIIWTGDVYRFFLTDYYWKKTFIIIILEIKYNIRLIRY